MPARLAPVWVGYLELFESHLTLGLSSAHGGVNHGDVWKSSALDQAVSNVNAESGSTAVKPETQNIVEELENLWVLPVQIRLG